MDLTGLTEDEYAAAMEAVEHVRVLRLREMIGGDHLLIYAARQNSDLTEGRGPYVDRGFFLQIEHAELARGLLDGVQGTPNEASVEQRRVYLSVDDWLRGDNGMILNGAGRSRFAMATNSSDKG
jgi:hypothetical protein